MNKKSGVMDKYGGSGQLKVFYPSLLGNTELLRTLLSRIQINESLEGHCRQSETPPFGLFMVPVTTWAE